MEQAGQKHTNIVENTLGTSVKNPERFKFIDGQWWYTGDSDREKRSLESYTKKNKNRMFVDGKYIPKSHPLHKPGNYKGFTDAAFSSLDNYEASKQGQIYIVISPAYPGWCKVGMAVDAEDRLKQYQTSSPYRDYKLVKAYDVLDRRKAEKFAHELLAKSHSRKGEWFYLQHPVATSILELPMRKFQ